MDKEFKDVSQEQFALMVMETAKKDDKYKSGPEKLKGFAKLVAEKFMKYKEKAVEMLKDAEKLEALLVEVEDKIKKVPKVGDKLAYIPQMALMIRSYIIGEYKEVSAVELALIVAALIYFVSPLDIIPDGIISVGFIDDAIVCAIVVYLCDKEITKYMEWRQENK